MNKLGPLPWRLTFSYGRALQTAALLTWNGKAENVAAAQKAFAHRARMNALASPGEWRPSSIWRLNAPLSHSRPSSGLAVAGIFSAYALRQMADLFLIAPPDAEPRAFAAALKRQLAATAAKVLLLPRGKRSEGDYKALVKAVAPLCAGSRTSRC